VNKPLANLNEHLSNLIASRLLEGKVVPVLGAGVNLCGRPPGATWRRGTYLPDGRELAEELTPPGFPEIGCHELTTIAQYIAVLEGEGPLYDRLHELLDANYPPTSLHRFLASLSRRMRESAESECLLIVTTNYDDSLERAFQEESEAYDLVTYIAYGQHRGRFLHTPPDGTSTIIDRPNEYIDVGLDQRAVIAKVHGAVDRAHCDQLNGSGARPAAPRHRPAPPRSDSYVITEDHYIDYLTHADFTTLFPVSLASKLHRSHFLFLGYSLRDWNLRVMLYRLRAKQEGRNYRSWSIQPDPSPIDRAVWEERGVDILPMLVEDFVSAMEAAS
jgi:hypothetical protein